MLFSVIKKCFEFVFGQTSNLNIKRVPQEVTLRGLINKSSTVKLISKFKGSSEIVQNIQGLNKPIPDISSHLTLEPDLILLIRNIQLFVTSVVSVYKIWCRI